MAPTIYGYARVSTQDQKLDLQTDALKKAGCQKIIVEKASAAKERPELNKLLKQLTAGDSLIVWKLDRLGRSLRHLVDLVAMFGEKGVQFISIQDSINTTTASGRLMFNIAASFAEFERDIIRERTNAGLEAARARGRKGGRPPGLSYEKQLKAQQAKQLFKNKSVKIKDACKKLNICKKTFYRYQTIETPDVV